MVKANAEYIGLKGKQILTKAFAGWSFYGFDFPSSGTNGCTGEKCISQGVAFFLRRKTAAGTWQASPDDAVGLLSAHLYFKASCGDIKDSTQSLKLKLHEFHMTMRRSKRQALIDDSGASILTSKESIHINRNTAWGRSDNIDELVLALASDLPGVQAFTRAELLDFLTGYRQLTQQRMAMLADELLVEAPKRLSEKIGIPVTADPDESITGH